MTEQTVQDLVLRIAQVEEHVNTAGEALACVLRRLRIVPLVLTSHQPHLHLPLAVFHAPALLPASRVALEVARVLAVQVSTTPHECKLSTAFSVASASSCASNAPLAPGNPRSWCCSRCFVLFTVLVSQPTYNQIVHPARSSPSASTSPRDAIPRNDLRRHELVHDHVRWDRSLKK